MRAIQELIATMRNRKPTISLDSVPEDCLSKVIKLTSPRDASRFTVVCAAFRSVADSDDVWEHFLPSDLPSILLRADEMGDHLLLLKKKELYLRLSRNWISLDGGLKSFGLDLSSGAKKLFLPKEHLSIIDTRQSARPPQLWIAGTVDYNDLSPGTNYAAYLVFTTAAAATYSHHDMQNNQQQSRLEFLNDLARAIEPMSKARRRSKSGHYIFFLYKELRKDRNGVKEESRMRNDGRWEINLGRFKSRSGIGMDEGLPFTFFDNETKLLKNDLIVEGVEVRPTDVADLA